MSNKTKKSQFTVTITGEDGQEKELSLAIASPTWDEQQDAQDKYNLTFKRACDNEALLRPRLDDFLKDQKVWTPEKEAELTSLQKQFQDLLYKMSKGGSLDDLVPLTREIKETRNKINEVANVRDQYSGNTAEGQAENMRFACLLAASVVYNDTGKRYWPTVDDYLAESSNEVAGAAAEKYAAILVGLTDENPTAELPENKLLIKLKLMNKDCRYLTKDTKKPYAPIKVDGEWVDILLDKEGRFINEDDELIDAYGRLVDEDGEFVEAGQWVTDEPKKAKKTKAKVEKEAKAEAKDWVEA